MNDIHAPYNMLTTQLPASVVEIEVDVLERQMIQQDVDSHMAVIRPVLR